MSVCRCGHPRVSHRTTPPANGTCLVPECGCIKFALSTRNAGLSGHDGLTARLCRAVGFDPNMIQGFRLTVVGGHFPRLEVLTLPPIEGGEIADAWSGPLAEVTATYALHPEDGAVPVAGPAPVDQQGVTEWLRANPTLAFRALVDAGLIDRATDA